MRCSRRGAPEASRDALRAAPAAPRGSGGTRAAATADGACGGAGEARGTRGRKGRFGVVAHSSIPFVRAIAAGHPPAARRVAPVPRMTSRFHVLSSYGYEGCDRPALRRMLSRTVLTTAEASRAIGAWCRGADSGCRRRGEAWPSYALCALSATYRRPSAKSDALGNLSRSIRYWAMMPVINTL